MARRTAGADVKGALRIDPGCRQTAGPRRLIEYPVSPFSASNGLSPSAARQCRSDRKVGICSRNTAVRPAAQASSPSGPDVGSGPGNPAARCSLERSTCSRDRQKPPGKAARRGPSTVVRIRPRGAPRVFQACLRIRHHPDASCRNGGRPAFWRPPPCPGDDRPIDDSCPVRLARLSDFRQARALWSIPKTAVGIPRSRNKVRYS